MPPAQAHGPLPAAATHFRAHTVTEMVWIPKPHSPYAFSPARGAGVDAPRSEPSAATGRQLAFASRFHKSIVSETTNALRTVGNSSGTSTLARRLNKSSGSIEPTSRSSIMST